MDPRDHLTRSSLLAGWEMGFMNPARRSLAHPDSRDFMGGDGTVAKAPTDNTDVVAYDPDTKTTWYPRVAEGMAGYSEGGSEITLDGIKFVMTHLKGPKWRDHLYTDVLYEDALDPESPSGEGAVALDAIKHIDKHIKLLAEDGIELGLRGFVWDNILHDKYTREIHDLGYLAISPVTAKELIRDEAGKIIERVEKSKKLEVARFTTTRPGRKDPHIINCQHSIWGHGGALHHEVVVNGQPALLPLTVKKFEQRGRLFYHLVKIPCTQIDGEHEYRVPTRQTKEDTKRGILRQEVLRDFPPSSDPRTPYGSLYKWLRNVTEWSHSQLDALLKHKRVPAYGQHGRHMLMAGYCLGENAVARSLHYARQGQGPLADLKPELDKADGRLAPVAAAQAAADAADLDAR